MPLTDNAIKSAKPESGPKRLDDSGGLYLEIASSGAEYWRFDYRFAKREKASSSRCLPQSQFETAEISAR
jgi:hypothetical protein